MSLDSRGLQDLELKLIYEYCFDGTKSLDLVSVNSSSFRWFDDVVGFGIKCLTRFSTFSL